MKTFAYAVCVLSLALMLSPRASAGVISALLSVNSASDVIKDDSHGFLIDVNNSGSVDVGDVGFGIARVDEINSDGTVKGRAYVVYSAEISNISGNTVTHTITSNTSGYTLESLLNFSQDTFGNSIAVLLEWNGSGSNPFLDSSAYPFGGSGGSFSGKTPSEMMSDLQTLAANSTIWFGVGLSGNLDAFTITLNTNPDLLGRYFHSVSAALSVTYVNGALDGNDFLPLFVNPNFFAAGQVQMRLNKDPTTSPFGYDYDTQGGSISTNDDGNYYVNYVPEPASMIGLASLALAGAGLGFVRRRKA